MLYGIDTSNWQGHVEWGSVKRQGFDFGAPKATQGCQYQDQFFPDSWEQLASLGMHRMAYQFYIDAWSGVEQCDYFHEYVRNHGHFRWGDMAALDVEEVGITKGAESVPELIAFIRHFWLTVAKPIVIYTNWDTWVNFLGNPQHPVFSACPLWYGDLGTYGQLPAPWHGGPAFEQWSWKGRLTGVNGTVDLDRFRGSRHQLDLIRYTVPHGL